MADGNTNLYSLTNELTKHDPPAMQMTAWESYCHIIAMITDADGWPALTVDDRAALRKVLMFVERKGLLKLHDELHAFELHRTVGGSH